MKKILLPIILLIGLYSCQNNDQKKISAQVDSSGITAANKVEAYKKFLVQLDTTAIEKNEEAAKKFQEFFSGGPSSQGDSAYLAFFDFYSILENSLNRKLENDPSGYDSLLMEFAPGVKAKLSEKLIRFNTTLKTNGFELAWDEGMTYVIKDGDFVEKWFYASLSPAMKEYLTQENKEGKERYRSDAGIVIDSKPLADRAIWWEKFVAQYPGFVFASKAIEKKKEYFQVMLTGMDNTPLMEYENPEKITPYFDKLYSYLLSAYPDAEACTLIKPYYAALKQKNKKEAERLREEYLSKMK